MPQTKKEKSYVFRLTVTLLHLAFWAELGVLTRAFVGKALEAGCGDSWGPCLEGAPCAGRVLDATVLCSHVLMPGDAGKPMAVKQLP